MFKELWYTVFQPEEKGGKTLVLKSIFLLGVKTISSFMGLGIVLLLSNALGSEELGYYQYAFTWTSVLTLVGVAGFDRLMVREFARFTLKGKQGLMWGIYRWTQPKILLISFVVCVVAMGVSFIDLEFFQDSKTRLTFRLALLAIPVSALIAHRRATLNAVKEVMVSYYAENLIQPGLLLLPLGLVWFFAEREGTLDAVLAISINLGAILVSLVYIQWQVNKRVPKANRVMPDEKEKARWWRQALVVLTFNLAMVTFARLDVLMLAPMAGQKAVGVYSVPFKLASYMNFILIAFNGVIAPNISQFHHEGKKKEMQYMVTRTAHGATALALPIAAILVLGRDWILSLFGDEFTAGGFALIVMIAGQFVNLICGPVGNLLIMTRHEKTASWCFGFSTLVNFGLNGYLIPLYSYEGAAIATAVSLALNNILMLFFVVRKLGINPTIFRINHKLF